MHGYPHHYFNATPTGNRSLFEALCDITSVEIHEHHHPVIAAQWILTAWRNGLPIDVAQKFEAMAVGILIKDQLEVQLGRDYCLELHPELKKAIASGSMMTAVKRAVSEAATTAGADWQSVELARQNAELWAELNLIRRSKSWQITAPLRALARWLRNARTRS